MAGDWIPMRLDLAEDPAVMQMASELKCREELVVGYLHKIWSWMSRQMCDKRVTGVTLESLGRVTNLHGFPELMRDVGWLTAGDDHGTPYVEVPNFERWLAKSAKTRLKAAERQRSSRVNRNGDVTKLSRSQRDKSVTRGEERRGEDKGERSIKMVADFLNVIKSMEIDKEIKSLLSTWILAIDAAGKFNPVAQQFEMSKLLGMGWSKERIAAAIENSIGGPYPKFYDQADKPNGTNKGPLDGLSEPERQKAITKAKIRIECHRAEGKPENDRIANEIAKEFGIEC